jgi:hypothetical protein
MNRRTFLCGLTLATLAGPLATEAQRAGKVYRIGFLITGSSTDQRHLIGRFRLPADGGADPSSPEGTTRTVAPVDSPNHSSDSAYS